MIAILLIVMLLISLVHITAFAEESQLQQDVNGVDYVNMHATGTDALDLTVKANDFSMHVYDNDGASSDYSNNCNGTLFITAPSGYVLRISGTGETEDGYDYLYIYDGDTNVSLGAEKYTDDFTVDEAYSSGNVLKLKLTSDSSETYYGFELEVTVIDLSTMAKIAYSYAGNEISSYKIKGTQLTLPVFADLFIAPAGATFLGWKCGETLYNEGDNFTLTEDTVFSAITEEPHVIFGDDTNGGYANMPVSGTATADLSDKTEGFTLKVNDDGGSENLYSNNCNGYLRIIAPAGYVLKISGNG